MKSREYLFKFAKEKPVTIETKNKMKNIQKKIWNESPNRKKELSLRTSLLMTGVSKSLTTRTKISSTLMGVKHTEERNKRKSERQKKIFKLIKSDNSIVITSDLEKYCKENNYITSCISNLKSKRIKYHKDIIYVETINQL
jgi:hypothetical protein